MRLFFDSTTPALYVSPPPYALQVALGLFDGAMLEFRVLSAFVRAHLSTFRTPLCPPARPSHPLLYTPLKVLAGFILLVINSWRERRCHYTNLCATCKALLLCLGAANRFHTVRAKG